MSENTSIASKETERREARNELSLFPNFKFSFPFLKPKGGSKTEGDKAKEEASPEMEDPKPMIVRFPKAKVTVPPPEVAENHETGKTSNPIILWQVICLFGF